MPARALTVLVFMVLAVGSNRVVSQTSDPQAASATHASAEATRLAAWSDARMLGARQMPLPDIDPSAVREAYRRSGVVTGKQGIAPGKDPRPMGPRYSGDVKSTPLKWAGRLFSRTPKGDMSCSAQFIRSRIVLTAAHCVRDSETGRFYKNFLFALQYNRGNYSRRYAYRCAATHDGWVQPDFEKWMWDYAMLLVDGGSITGNFGYTWNWEGHYRDAVKIGYPIGVQNSQVIQVENGRVSISDGLAALWHGSKADQSGSSGGAWIGDYSSSLDGNVVISVTSFDWRFLPGVQFGPYFQSPFASLLEFTARGCR